MRPSCPQFIGLSFLASMNLSTSYAAETVLKETIVKAEPLSSDEREDRSPIVMKATNEAFREKQYTFAVEALQMSPSLSVVPSTFNRGLPRTEIRGSNTYNTIVLIDNVRENDPGVDGAFNITDLTPQDLQKMTVLPGPRALFYDHQAAGGIILFETRRGKDKPKLSYDLEGGQYRTQKAGLNIEGTQTSLDYYLGGSFLKTGTGVQKNRLHGNRVADHFQNGNGTLRTIFKPVSHFETDVTVRAGESRVLLNRRAQPFYTVSDNFSETDRYFFKVENRFETNDKKSRHRLLLANNGTRRTTMFDASPYLTHGENQHIKYYFDWDISKFHTLTLGVEHLREIANLQNVGTKTDHLTTLVSQYNRHLSERLKLIIGSRFIKHREFATKMTPWIGLDYDLFDSTTIFTSYGLGYRFPLIMDLYQSHPNKIGNPTLRPENTRSFEFGVRQSFLDETIIGSLTYFHLISTDLISTRQLSNQTFQKINKGRRRSQGLETSLTYKISLKWDLQVAYTFMDATESARDQRALYLPTHTVSGGLNFKPQENLKTFLSAYYKSSQGDLNFAVFPAQPVSLPPSLTIRAGANYMVDDSFEIYGRVENVLNDKSESFYGYGSRDIGAFAGMRITWQ